MGDGGRGIGSEKRRGRGLRKLRPQERGRGGLAGAGKLTGLLGCVGKLPRGRRGVAGKLLQCSDVLGPSSVAPEKAER